MISIPLPPSVAIPSVFKVSYKEQTSLLIWQSRRRGRGWWWKSQLDAELKATVNLAQRRRETYLEAFLESVRRQQGSPERCDNLYNQGPSRLRGQSCFIQTRASAPKSSTTHSELSRDPAPHGTPRFRGPCGTPRPSPWAPGALVSAPSNPNSAPQPTATLLRLLPQTPPATHQPGTGRT